MMLRYITVLSIIALLFSCRWKAPEKPKAKEKESQVITSLKLSSLPCFSCHSYERFAANEPGKFSHQKHTGYGVHCNMCHIMEAHHSSSIRKDLCKNCHDLKNFSYTGSGMPVTFSHQNHTKKFSCDSCHPQLFQMKKGTTPMTMDEMYKGRSCGKCHDGKAAFSSQDCQKCHSTIAFSKSLTYPSSGLNPAVFSHKTHTAMFACNSCHPSPFKFKKDASGMKMDTIYKKKYCGQCHDGQTAFGPMACQRCHK